MAAYTAYHDSDFRVNPLNLKTTYLRTYLIIKSLAKRQGYCYATNEAICNLRGVCQQTIGRHLIKLAALGFIEVIIEDGYRRIIRLLPTFKNALKMSKKCVSPQSIKSIGTKETTNTPAPPSAPVPAEDAAVVVPQCQKSPKNDNSPTSVVRSDITDKLTALGVQPPSFARSLAAQYEERAIVEAIRHYRETPTARGVGWLVTAIQRGFKWESRKVDQCPHRIIKAPAEPPTVASGGVEDVRNIVEGIRARTGILRRAGDCQPGAS